MMIFEELGVTLVDVDIKSRMLTFWARYVQETNTISIIESTH